LSPLRLPFRHPGRSGIHDARIASGAGKAAIIAHLGAIPRAARA
jgi:hypothetical protein